MIPIACTVLVWAAAGSPLPDPEPPLPNAVEGGWSALDADVDRLAQGLGPHTRRVGWTALVRTYYAYGGDDVSEGPGLVDVSGFRFQDVDLAFWGEVGTTHWRIGLDTVDRTTSSLEVEDAYLLFEFLSGFQTMFGRFKAPAFQSSIVAPENQLFVDRTVIGSAFELYDTGFQVAGSAEAFDWAFWIQDGATGVVSDHRYGVRLAWHVGEGAGHYEGARDKPEGFNATLGLMLLNDDTRRGDQAAYGVDFNGNWGRVGFGAEFLRLDDDSDFYTTNARDFGVIGAGALTFDNGPQEDTTPHAITLSYAFDEDLELGVRGEAMDDADDTVLMSAVLNLYKAGNRAKFSLQWTRVDTDGTTPDDEGDYFLAGLSLGSTR